MKSKLFSLTYPAPSNLHTGCLPDYRLPASARIPRRPINLQVKGPAAFTLIELLVVIAIIAVLAALIFQP